MKKYKYNINNLDCANCAREVEEKLNKDKRIKNCIVNFNTSKVSFEGSEDIKIDEVNKIVQSVEPECSITEDNIDKKSDYSIIILIIAIIVGFGGYFIKINIFIIISYVLLLYRPFINACKSLVKNKSINENMLIVVSCIGAYFLGEVLEGMMVIILYTIGKILENIAINNTRREVKNILDIKQDYANLKVGEEVKKINIEEIKVGDNLVIKKGERIPVDGKIIEGNTYLDMMALTGESEKVKVGVGKEVLSGSINDGDVIIIESSKLYEDSTVAKILSLVEDATDKKAKIETSVSKLSSIYTPIILIFAVCVFIFLPMISNISYYDSMYRALTFLVISCPCAIAISVPLSYFTGIGVASKNGILIKGSNYLDNLSKLDGIIFDKTGTITSGSFSVSKIEIFDDNYTNKDIIDIITKGESLSNHPVASSIVKLAKKIDNSNVKEFREISGKGISFKIDDKSVSIGNDKICECDTETDIHVNINGKHVASIYIDDGIKKNTKKVIECLKNKGIKTFMFTGDKEKVAKDVAGKVGIDEYYAEMLPQEKYEKYEEVSKDKNIAFVGDGINDAPVIKRAFIGISMGSIGSNSAIDASDIVIMNDDLGRINKGIDISKYTNFIIRENLVFALGVKIIILLLSVFGIATMWFAVFADTGVTLITILNTLRIMKKYKE